MLAKKGAKTHRVPKWLRTKIETAERVALRAALQLGVTTHAANNVTIAEIKDDGNVVNRTFRDSNGEPRGSALRKARAAPKATKAKKTTGNEEKVTSGAKTVKQSPAFNKKTRRAGKIRTFKPAVGQPHTPRVACTVEST